MPFSGTRTWVKNSLWCAQVPKRVSTVQWRKECNKDQVHAYFESHRKRPSNLRRLGACVAEIRPPQHCNWTVSRSDHVNEKTSTTTAAQGGKAGGAGRLSLSPAEVQAILNGHDSFVAKLVVLIATPFSGDLICGDRVWAASHILWAWSQRDTVGFDQHQTWHQRYGKSEFLDHLLINTSGTTEWNNIVKDNDNVELARKNTKPTPMDLSAVGQDQKFQGGPHFQNTFPFALSSFVVFLNWLGLSFPECFFCSKKESHFPDWIF